MFINTMCFLCIMSIENLLSSEEALAFELQNNPLDHEAEKAHRIKASLGIIAGALGLSVAGAIGMHYIKENMDIVLKSIQPMANICGSAGVPGAYLLYEGVKSIYDFITDTTNFFIPGERDGEIYFRDGQFTDKATMLDVNKGYSVAPISYAEELESEVAAEYYFANGVNVLGKAVKLDKTEKKALGADKTFWKVPAKYNGTDVTLLFDGNKDNFGRIKKLRKGDTLYCMGDYRINNNFIPVAHFGNAVYRNADAIL